MKYSLFFIMLFAWPLMAASTTLDELISMGLERHPETQQAWWQAKRAAAALGSAKSAYYPQLDLDLNVSNGKTFKFVNGPDASFTIAGVDLTLSYLLYDFGGREANVQAAKSALKAAGWNTNWIIQGVMVNILQNAYSVLHAQQVLEASWESVRDAELLYESARELNQAGLTPITDVYTTQATLAQMKMEAAVQKGTLAVEKGKLAVSVGLMADSPLLMAPIAEPEPIEPGNLQELICLAKKQRADLQAKQARVAEALARQQQTKALSKPTLTASATGGFNHAFEDRAQAAQYVVALNLGVPLFTGFDLTYQNRMAFADTKISLSELAQLEQNISLEVLTYSTTLEATIEMLPLAQENLRDAQLAYEGVLEKYQAGKERLAEVSNAQRQLALARVRLNDVKTRMWTAMANLAYATGTLAPYLEDVCVDQ